MDLFDKIEREEGEWDDLYSTSLREELLSSPALRLALKEIILEADEQAKQLAHMDLASDPSKAIKQQGKVLGMKRALDIILEKAQDKENEDG